EIRPVHSGGKWLVGNEVPIGPRNRRRIAWDRRILQGGKSVDVLEGLVRREHDAADAGSKRRSHDGYPVVRTTDTDGDRSARAINAQAAGRKRPVDPSQLACVDLLQRSRSDE